MTRPLRIVVGVDETLRALRAALSASGDAVFPLPARGAEHEQRLPRDVSQRTALVVQTSGTSQKPKRVALSSDAVLASAAASASALGGEGQWLLAVPSHYIAGVNVLVRSITSGWEPVVSDSASTGGFTAAGFVAAAERLEAPLRFTALVPAQLARLLADSAGVDALRSLSAVLVGGQSMPGSLASAASQLGIRVVRSYGSSETSGGCVYDGRPIGQTVARIRAGQIEITGPSLADGYLGDPERTDEVFIIDEGLRWYRTGDAGTLIDGVLAVSGRLDDVIISGGIKVSLSDIEAIVREIVGYGDAVVVGMASEKWGEVPVVVVPAAAAATARAAENSDIGDVDDDGLTMLTALVTVRLGREAAPARIVQLDELPLLPSGKPDRRAIAAAVN